MVAAQKLKVALAHVCLVVTDLDVAMQFYCDGLGMTKKFDLMVGLLRRGCYLEAENGCFLELIEGKLANPAPQAFSHLCFSVPDTELFAAMLRERGLPVTDPIVGPDNTYQAWTADPDGNRIEIQSYQASSCQITGKDCYLA